MISKSQALAAVWKSGEYAKIISKAWIAHNSLIIEQPQCLGRNSTCNSRKQRRGAIAFNHLELLSFYGLDYGFLVLKRVLGKR